MNKNRILFISPWFPNTKNPTLGNFIIRQAQLIAEDHSVFFIALTPTKEIKDSCRIEEIVDKGFEGLHIYHNSKLPFSLFHYHRCLIEAKRILKQRHLNFDLIHSQIMHRSGYATHFFSSAFNIPAVSSEHWSGYTPERNESLNLFEKLNVLFANRVVKKFLPVTQHLGSSMRDFGIRPKFEVWYNVVDAELFYFEEEKEFTFIHISTLDANKRPLDILSAFHTVWKEFPEVRMSLGGDGDTDPLIMERKRLSIPIENLEIHSAIPYSEAASRMRHSQCLIQFSNFENLPCTISEAMSAGLYVISSDVGGIKEVLQSETIGVVIPAGNIDLLGKAMLTFYKNRLKSVQSSSTLFNPISLKRQINRVYNDLVNHK